MLCHVASWDLRSRWGRARVPLNGRNLSKTKRMVKIKFRLSERERKSKTSFKTVVLLLFIVIHLNSYIRFEV